MAPTMVLDKALDLLQRPGLTGRVRTRGWSWDADGAGQDWQIHDTAPAGRAGLMALPTVDGRWAVPTSFATAPPRRPLGGAGLQDVMRRAYTFRDQGGTDLRWSGQRPGPGLSIAPVHSSQAKPYPVSCSHFIGMVTAGWEYASTTYVADANTRTGWYVPYGQPIGPGQQLIIWQACLSARFFFSAGDMWATDGTDIARGDLLYFCQHDPEKTWERAQHGEITAYFANVYHTALYVGDATVLQSATPTSPTGVYEAPLSGLASTLALAARPRWAPPQDTALSIWLDDHETPIAT